MRLKEILVHPNQRRYPGQLVLVVAYREYVFLMKKLDRYEREILGAYEKVALVSVHPTKAQLAGFREAARATFVENRRVNIRLSADDFRNPGPGL